MNYIETMKQALEALEENRHLIKEHERPYYLALYDSRIHALRTAIEIAESDMPKIGCVNHDCDQCKAAEKQEPYKGLSEHMAQATGGRVRIDPVTGDVGIGTPAAQPIIERYPEKDNSQRQWVGLTDEDYKQLHIQMGPVYFYQDYGHAIEAKLREKNGGAA